MEQSCGLVLREQLLHAIRELLWILLLHECNRLLDLFGFARRHHLTARVAWLEIFSDFNSARSLEQRVDQSGGDHPRIVVRIFQIRRRESGLAKDGGSRRQGFCSSEAAAAAFRVNNGGQFSVINWHARWLRRRR